MSLESLPEEIFILILRRLDMKSILNFYEASNKAVRNILCIPGVIKECNFSLNPLATTESLKLDFVQNISWHLQSLNLCGVHNLSKTSLIPALRKMRTLVKLDVSYTNITLPDLLDIYEACPTIKDIAIDFDFPVSYKVLTPDILTKFQKMFQNMENVNFIGSDENLLRSKLPQCLLKGAKLNALKYTIAKMSRMFTFHKYDDSEVPEYNHFIICYLNWVRESRFEIGLTYCEILSDDYIFNLTDFAILAMDWSSSSGCNVYGSPEFTNFFLERYGIKLVPKNKYEIKSLIRHQYNFAVMIWNKGTTEFNDLFYHALHLKIKDLFPCNNTRDYDIPNNDWFFMRTIEDIPEQRLLRPPEPTNPKRSRIAPSNTVLNYDELCKKHDSVQMTFDFNRIGLSSPVSLPMSCEYLRKLSYLNLFGFVRYTSGFFNVLFRSCDNLTTLNVEAPSVSPCASYIARSVPLSRSLKNLRIVDKVIDFQSLFPALSQCKTLENIHIHDECVLVTRELASPQTVFENCKNLYYMCLRISLSETALKQVNSVLKKARVKCGRSHLRFELHNNNIQKDVKYSYNPFISVFRLYPLKHL